MPRCALILLLCACTVQTPIGGSTPYPPQPDPSQPTAAQPITLGLARYEVGQVIVVEQREHVELREGTDVDSKAEPLVAGHSLARRREEVVRVADGRPALRRVVWEANESVLRADGQEQSEPNPLHGEYLVEHVDHATRVARPDGSTVGDDEAAEIVAFFQHPGAIMLFERQLAGCTLAPGWTMDVDTSTTQAQPRADRQTKLLDHLVYTGTQIAGGRLQATFTTESWQGGPYGFGDVETTTRGSMVVDVETGWLVAIQYGGPIRLRGTEGELGVVRDYAGSGRWSFAATFDHRDQPQTSSVSNSAS